MSIAVTSSDAAQITRVRQLSGAVAIAVLVDVAWVRAPFLAFLAVPFAVAAWRYRRGRAVTTVALTLWCALYTLIGVIYAINNGLHDPQGPGETVTHWINPGDFVAIYIGTPIAIWLAVVLVTRLTGRRSTSPQSAVA